MTRIIKFRAINAEGKMIYGLPYTDGINDTIYFKDYNNRLCWRDEQGAHCNQPYKNGTLMQYTGLKDKNGKEIYEGDIVHLSSGSIGQISYNTHNTGFTLTPNKTNQRPEVVLGNLHTGMGVIGNIYENPELLEAQKEGM